MEDVHNLDGKHDLLLGEHVANDNECDIILEFLDCVSKLFFWQALLEELDDEILVWLKLINTQLKQPDDLEIDLEVVVTQHVAHLEEHDETT